jgi:hypothetical protein
MTDASQAIASLPSNLTAKRVEKLKITAKVRAAIHAMVWQGLKRDQAAESAGIKDNSLYIALRRPDVKQFYLSELDVLRTSERARNIHALVEVRDQEENKMARVQAVKALEQISDEAPAARGSQSQPGLTIVINTVAPPSFKVVDNELPQAISTP